MGPSARDPGRGGGRPAPTPLELHNLAGNARVFLMTTRENATERLHVMVTPSQKELVERAARLPQFSSEAAVIRYLIESDLADLLEFAEADRALRRQEKERAAAKAREAADYLDRYDKRTRLLVDTADPAPYAGDPLEDVDLEELPPAAAPRGHRPQVSLRGGSVGEPKITMPPMVEMPVDPFGFGTPDGLPPVVE